MGNSQDKQINELVKDLQKENERLQNVCNQHVLERFIQNKTETSTNTEIETMKETSTNTEHKKFCNKGTMTDIEEIDTNVPQLRNSIRHYEEGINQLSTKLQNANIFKRKGYKKQIKKDTMMKMENLGKLCEILG